MYNEVKPVEWMGSSLKNLKAFPKNVQKDIGQALYIAQAGTEDPTAKALKGFGGRSVLEIVASGKGATFRAIYTVRFKETLYVLHSFQKKSTKGIATAQRDIDLIRQRLTEAENHYKQRGH